MTEKEMIEKIRQNLEDINGMKGIRILGYIPLAEELVKQGYRKIPEGSVVLTKDEWARLRNLEINYDDAYEHYLEYEIENQQLKKQVKELEEQRDRQAYIAEELIQEKHRWTDQSRKETAKEILNELWHSKLETTITVSSKHNIEDIKIACQAVVDSIRDKIQELAKKYGVEVEE